MHRLVVLCAVILFSIGEARFYRASRTNLKSQDASDIAPTGEYQEAGYKGFIHHESAEVRDNKEDAILDASKIIRKKVAQGLRQHFGKLQAVLTAFADDDGFVREGIVFCGASEQEYDEELEDRPDFTVNDTMPTTFHPNGARLIDYDGWGVVANEVHQKVYDAEQCGINNCQEGSVVAAIANEIRSTGYQIQHKDICLADANAVELKARSANLLAYDAKPALLCNGTNGEVWFDVLRDCIGVDPDIECGAGCTINKNDAEAQDQMCWVDPEQHTECNVVQEGDDKADENIGSTAGFINAIRRVMRYSLNKDISAVQTTDYAYITGCTTGNCKSLRNLFAALNGNAQISAFRDLGVEESIAYWESEIKSARTYLQGLADTFRNFRPITLDLFPFIEEEEIEGCPMGEVEKTDEDTGSEVAPLCYQKSLDINDLNKLSRDGQFISRSTCFCRNGKLDQENGEDVYIDIEKDDIYLSVEDLEVTQAECDKMPTSVRTYCREVGSWGSRGPWKSTLESLLPPSTIGRIKIYDEDVSTHHAKRQTIVDNLVKTLPTKLDTSCGRIVNADSETSTDASKLLRSNKGGNCLPFAKLYEIFYRLEYETGEQGMGMYKCQADKTCPETGQTIEQSFCADKLETTELSFRQLAYKWDVADASSSVRITSTDPFVGDDDAAYGGGFLTYTGETYSDGDETVERSFCLVDWLSEFGLHPITDAGGHYYSNPFTAIKKYIDEAVFNTELAQSTKSKVISDNIDIWKAIRKELTTAEDENILDDIAEAAATHYLYIMTTDEDDVMDQETFRESAQVKQEIRAFTEQIQPVVNKLPTLSTDLTELAEQHVAIDNVNSTVTAAFDDIRSVIQSLPNAPTLQRRHFRRKMIKRNLEATQEASDDENDCGLTLCEDVAQTNNEIDQNCVACFGAVDYSRTDVSHETSALVLVNEDIATATEEKDALTVIKNDAVAHNNEFPSPENKEAVEKAELDEKYAENTITGKQKVKTYIQLREDNPTTAKDTVAAERATNDGLKTAAEAELVTKVNEKDIKRQERQQAIYAKDTEKVSNNPDQAEIARLTTLISDREQEMKTLSTDIFNIKVNIDKYTKLIEAADVWEPYYWNYIPLATWGPQLVDTIESKHDACQLCQQHNGGDEYFKQIGTDANTLGASTKRPNLPNRYDEVADDVKEDIARNVASISLDITQIIKAIQDLSKNSATKENIESSKAVISAKIQELWSTVSVFEQAAIEDLEKLAEYEINRNAYLNFWDATQYTGDYSPVNKLPADRRDFTVVTAGGDTWPEAADVKAECQAQLQTIFNQAVTGAETLTGTYADLLAANVKVRADMGENPADTYLSGILDTQIANLEEYRDRCDVVTYDKDALYGDFVDLCGVAYPFGSDDDCKTARDAITARIADNNNLLNGDGVSKGIYDLAIENKDALAKSQDAINAYRASIDNAAADKYNSIKSKFLVKADDTLAKYKLFALPSNDQDATDENFLSDTLKATRNACLNEIDLVLEATKELVRSNTADIKDDDNATITEARLARPTNIAGANAVHVLVKKVVEDFNFVSDDIGANIAAYEAVFDPIEDVGGNIKCEASGLEDVVVTNLAKDNGAKSVIRDVVLNYIRIECSPGYDFETDRCAVAPCVRGEYFEKTVTEEATSGECKPCPAGQYSDTAAQSWTVGSDDEDKCKPCADGSFAAEGSSSCTAAGKGNYATLDKSEAKECRPGSYSGVTNAQEVEEATDTTDTTGCTFAQPGHFVELAGEQSQRECGAGSYQPNKNKSSCVLASKGFYVSENAQTEQLSCGGVPGSDPMGGQDIFNRYSDEEGSTSCKVCQEGAVILEGNSKCETCTGPDKYCDGEKVRQNCNNEAPDYLVQTGAGVSKPCIARRCTCELGTPTEGEQCSESGTHECVSCDAGAGLYPKKDTNGNIIENKHVCRQCSRPLFNDEDNTVSTCAVESCPVGQGYPSSAVDMSNIGASDDNEGAFAGILCGACPVGSYSDKNEVGQCVKLDSGYECATSSQDDVSGEGCATKKLCDVGKYRVKSSSDVDVNDDTNVCVEIPAGFQCTASAGANTSTTGCAAIQKCPRGFFRDVGATNLCVAIPAGKGCDKVNNGTHIISASAKSETGCKSTVLCDSGNFREEDSTDTICSVIPAGKGCKPGSLGSVDSQDAKGCKEVQVCPKAYFRGEKYVGTTELENNLDETFCSPCPEGQHCANCGTSDNGYPVQPDSADATQCRATYRCPSHQYRQHSDTGSTCTDIPAGSQCFFAGESPTNVNGFLVTYNDEYLGNTGDGCTNQIGCGGGSYGSGGNQPCQPCQPCADGSTASSECGGSSGGSCESCSAGTYGAGSGMGCSSCDAGKFNANTGSTGADSCETCPVGTYSDFGASSCTKCGTGKFNANTGSALESDCETCAKGTYNDVEGASECKKCSKGTYNPSQASSTASACKDCEAGKYNDKEAQESCTDCGANHYAPIKSETADSCKKCPANTEHPTGFIATVGECNDCEANEFAVSGSACSNCAAGKTSVSGGQCTDCEAGKTSISGESCQACPANSFANVTAGNIECTNCTAGKAATSGSPCTNCAAGKISAEGQSCTDCEAGTSSEEGKDECTACVAGKFSEKGGLCTPCAAGKISTEAGASACSNIDGGKRCKDRVTNGCDEAEACPDGTFRSAAAASNDCTAVDDGYRANNGKEAQQKCDDDEISSEDKNSCVRCSDTKFTHPDGTESASINGLGSYPNDAQTACVNVTQGNVKKADGSGQQQNGCTCAGGDPTTGINCPVDGVEDCATCDEGNGRYAIFTSGADAGRSECVSCTLFSNKGISDNVNDEGKTTSVCAFEACQIGYGYEDPPFGMTVENFIEMVSQHSNMRGQGTPLDCEPCPDNTFSNSSEVGQCSACEKGHTHNEGRFKCVPCKGYDDVQDPDAYYAGPGCTRAVCDVFSVANSDTENKEIPVNQQHTVNCAAGYDNNGESSFVVSCSDLAQLSGQSTCEASCTGNEFFDGSGCATHTQCGNQVDGSSRLSNAGTHAAGSCNACSDLNSEATSTTDDCLCKDGYYNNNGVCEPHTECGYHLYHFGWDLNGDDLFLTRNGTVGATDDSDGYTLGGSGNQQPQNRLTGADQNNAGTCEPCKQYTVNGDVSQFPVALFAPTGADDCQLVTGAECDDLTYYRVAATATENTKCEQCPTGQFSDNTDVNNIFKTASECVEVVDRDTCVAAGLLFDNGHVFNPHAGHFESTPPKCTNGTSYTGTPIEITDVARDLENHLSTTCNITAKYPSVLTAPVDGVTNLPAQEITINGETVTVPYCHELEDGLLEPYAFCIPSCPSGEARQNEGAFVWCSDSASGYADDINLAITTYPQSVTTEYGTGIQYSTVHLNNLCGAPSCVVPVDANQLTTHPYINDEQLCSAEGDNFELQPGDECYKQCDNNLYDLVPADFTDITDYNAVQTAKITVDQQGMSVRCPGEDENAGIRDRKCISKPEPVNEPADPTECGMIGLSYIVERLPWTVYFENDGGMVVILKQKSYKSGEFTDDVLYNADDSLNFTRIAEKLNEACTEHCTGCVGDACNPYTVCADENDCGMGGAQQVQNAKTDQTVYWLIKGQCGSDPALEQEAHAHHVVSEAVICDASYPATQVEQRCECLAENLCEGNPKCALKTKNFEGVTETECKPKGRVDASCADIRTDATFQDMVDIEGWSGMCQQGPDCTLTDSMYNSNKGCNGNDEGNMYHSFCPHLKADKCTDYASKGCVLVNGACEIDIVVPERVAQAQCQQLTDYNTDDNCNGLVSVVNLGYMTQAQLNTHTSTSATCSDVKSDECAGLSNCKVDGDDCVSEVPLSFTELLTNQNTTFMEENPDWEPPSDDGHGGEGDEGDGHGNEGTTIEAGVLCSDLNDTSRTQKYSAECEGADKDDNSVSAKCEDLKGHTDNCHEYSWTFGNDPTVTVNCAVNTGDSTCYEQ